MADAPEAVRLRLTGHIGTNALIAGRVWHEALPQDPELPAITVAQLSGPRTRAMVRDTGNVGGRIQVASHAATRDGAKALAEQARAALQRFGGTVSGTVIDDMYVDNEIGPAYEPDEKLWRVIQDYFTWWREA